MWNIALDGTIDDPKLPSVVDANKDETIMIV